MKAESQVRLGNVLVSFMHQRRFLFQDAYDPSRILAVDEVDVPELILFLYQKSTMAQDRLQVTERSLRAD